jgi:DNA-binding transcriptional MerR regulator
MSLLPIAYEPPLEALHSLDDAARLAGVSRKVLLQYCRAGVVQPFFLPPYGVMVFDEEAVHRVRRIENMRARSDLLRTLHGLVDEVDRLRAEVRFWRDR